MLWPIEHADPLSPTLKLIILAVAVLVAGSIYVKFRHVSRDSSENRAEAVLGYVMSVLGSLLLFPAHPEIGFTVLAVLAFGDGSATFGGLLFPSRSLPWNQDKTVSGMFSFILMGTIMASVIYWGEANPGVDWMSALLIAVPTSICAAIAESLPVRLNDNVRVGVVAAIVAPIAHYFVLGVLNSPKKKRHSVERRETEPIEKAFACVSNISPLMSLIRMAWPAGIVSISGSPSNGK